MWFSLLLLPFCALAQLDPDHIISHIKEDIDPSVRPCDDFYRHVCPKELSPTDQIKQSLEKWFSDAVAPYEISSRYADFLTKFQTDRNNTNEEVPGDKLKLKLLQRCLTNESLFRHAYKLSARGVGEFQFTYCLNATKQQMAELTDEKLASMKRSKSRRDQQQLGFRSKWFGYVNDEKNEFAKKDRRALQLFEKSKTIMQDLLLKSTWVKKHNLADPIKYILDNLSLRSWRNTTEMKEDFDNFEKYYHDCIQGISGLLAVEYDQCFLNAREVYLPGESYFWGAEIYLRYTGRVTVYPPVYGSFELQDEMSVLTSFVYVIAHEIGHSIFLTVRAPQAPVDLECLKNHMHNACETFKEEWICESGKTTLQEDVADIAARTVTLHMAKDMAKSYSSTELHGLSWDQLYFYGVAINWCTKRNDGNPKAEHSSSVVRVNGVLSQSTDFQTAFGCKAGDRMVTPREKRCFIYGPPALISK